MYIELDYIIFVETSRLHIDTDKVKIITKDVSEFTELKAKLIVSLKHCTYEFISLCI